MTMTAPRDDNVQPLSDYDKLVQEHRAALEALRQLAEGVRIVTRQMKQQHNDDNDSVASGTSDATPLRGRAFSSGTVSSVCSMVSEDDKRIDDLSHSLDGPVGADLLGLSQAAQMLHEHARLASQEASVLTDDMVVARTTAEKSLERAIQAEKLVKRLHRENTTLQHQLDQLLLERKVLAKEIKSIRKENDALKKFQQDSKRQEMMLVLEEYVRGALLVHEQQLATASIIKRSESWDHTEEATETEATETKSKSEAVIDDAPESQAVTEPETDEESKSAFVMIVPQKEKEKPPTTAIRSVGFGSAGLAGYGYKYKKIKQPLTLSKVENETKPPLSTPTASTVVTEATTPATNDSVKTCNKENITKESSLSSGGKKIMDDLSMASSTFTNFFSSRTPKSSSHPPVQNQFFDRDPTTKSKVPAPAVTVNCDVPPSVTMDAPTILSPFAEDSPVATSHRHLDFGGNCDEHVLRSLSLPEEVPPDMNERPPTPSIIQSSMTGLYEA